MAPYIPHNIKLSLKFLAPSLITIWGVINPINDIGPAIATEELDSKITTIVAILFITLIFSPKLIAMASPIFNVSIEFDILIIKSIDIIKHGNNSTICVIWAWWTPPIIQNSKSDVLLSLNSIINFVMELKNNCILIPTNVTFNGDKFLILPIVWTVTPTNPAPKKDANIFVLYPNAGKNTITITTDKVAPAFIPKTWDDASGFLVKFCIINPEIAIDAPTNIHNNTRGSLIVVIIKSSLLPL